MNRPLGAMNIILVLEIFFLSSINSVAENINSPNFESKSPNEYPCGHSHFELFSCKMESGRLVAICLSKEARPHLSIIYNEKRSGQYSYIIDNPEQVVGENSHGDMTIISGNIPDDKFTLFIDTNHFDPAMAAITHNKGTTTTEFCAKSNFNTKSYYENVNGKYINIFSLINLGIARPLSVIPDWPSK